MKVIYHKLCGCINNRTCGFSIIEVNKKISFCINYLLVFQKRTKCLNEYITDVILLINNTEKVIEFFIIFWTLRMPAKYEYWFVTLSNNKGENRS